jgi:hypothetical protein
MKLKPLSKAAVMSNVRMRGLINFVNSLGDLGQPKKVPCGHMAVQRPIKSEQQHFLMLVCMP